jgi:hypothetical protein
MTRGRQPRVAIQEAMHAARDRGYEVIPIPVDYLAFDFIICSRHVTALVRVRRLRYARYDPKEILYSCEAEIAEIRGIAIFPETRRELWARGPHRGWRRYLIYSGAIEEIVEEEGEDPEDGISGPIPDSGSVRTGDKDEPGVNAAGSPGLDAPGIHEPPDEPRIPATSRGTNHAPLAGS